MVLILKNIKMPSFFQAYFGQAKILLNLNISKLLAECRHQIVSNVQRGQFNELLKFMPEVKSYFDKMESKGEPFCDFSHEPHLIIQIKTIINVLYQLEMIFSELEMHKDCEWSYEEILKSGYTLWQRGIIERSHRTGKLLVENLDINMIHIFSEEYASILQFLLWIQNQYRTFSTSLMDLQPYEASHQVGAFVGNVIHHMQTDPTKVDYNYLTQLGTILPSHIQEVTNYIRQYADELKTHAPRVKVNVKKLEQNAINLLLAINAAQNNKALWVVNGLYYIRIFRNIVELSSVTLNQVGLLSDTAQKMIRDNLEKIKNQLAKLLSFADKLENTFLLAPGTLSNALEEKILTYYKTLIHYSSKVASLGSVSTLNEINFIKKRIYESNQRIHHSRQLLMVTNRVLLAFDKFYESLEIIHKMDQKHLTHRRIIDLDPEIKTLLVGYYREIQAYVQAHSVNLDRSILRDFCATKGLSDQLSYFLTKSYAIVSAFIADNTVAKWPILPPKTIHAESEPFHSFPTSLSYLISIKSIIRKNIERIISSQKLSIKSNEQIIQRIFDATPLMLCPLESDHQQSFNCDEGKALELSDLSCIQEQKKTYYSLFTIGNPRILTSAQLFHLQQYYSTRMIEMQVAREAGIQFKRIIDDNGSNKTNVALGRFSTDIKNTLKKYYAQMQPLFVSIYGPNTDMLTLDKMIINSFNRSYEIQLWEQDEEITQPNTIYIKIKNFTFEYAMIDAFGIKRMGLIDINELKHLFIPPITLVQLQAAKTVILDFLIKAGQATPDAFDLMIDAELLTRTFQDFEERLTDAIRYAGAKINELEHEELEAYRYEIGHKNLWELNAHPTNLISLIHAANISKRIKKLTDQFYQQIQPLFNEFITCNLVRQNEGKPFPLIEKEQTPSLYALNTNLKPILFSQSKLLANLKNLFNGLYDLEKAFELLENLDHRDFQISYVYKLIQIYSHLHHLFDSIFTLATDSHISFLTKELIQALTLFKNAIDIHKNPYSKPQPSNTPGVMTITPLWYALHGIMISPEIILSTYNNTAISNEKLEIIKTNAKNIGIAIERVIEGSDSYFKLLLESPNIYALYSELKEKFLHFLDITYQGVTNEQFHFVEDLKRKWFVDILTRADQLEAEMGLTPGFITDPFKKILDEFYTGMVHAFHFSTSRLFDCLTSKVVFEQRERLNQQRWDEAMSHAQLYQQNYQDLVQLIYPMTAYQQSKNKKEKVQYKSLFLKTYRQAYPILIAYRQAYLQQSDREKKNIKWMNVYFKEENDFPPLNAGNEEEVANKALLEAARFILKYYEQLQFAASLECNYFSIKKLHLREVKDQDEKANYLSMKNHLINVFESSVQLIIEQQIPPTKCHNEYCQLLKQALDHHKNNILEEAKKSQDAQQTIRQRLHQLTDQFNASHRLDYERLNMYLTAIYELSNYIDNARLICEQANNSTKTTLFESKETLQRKSKWISIFLAIANDRKLSPGQRCQKIKEEMERKPTLRNPSTFKTDILTYCQYDHYCLKWLQQWLHSILSIFLSAYTPEHIMLYNKISEKAALKSDVISESWFNFFYSDKHNSTTKPTEKGINPIAKVENAANNAR